MVTSELWKKTAKKSKVTIQDTCEILKNTFEVIKEGLLEDGIVKIDGFGTFEIRAYKGKIGLNPQGEKCTRRAVNKVKFDAYKELETKAQFKKIIEKQEI